MRVLFPAVSVCVHVRLAIPQTRDSKSYQISRFLLKILANLGTTVIWMVSALLPTTSFPTPLTNLSWTVPSVPVVIDITVTFIFNKTFSSVVRSKYLSVFSFSLIFTMWLTGSSKFTIIIDIPCEFFTPALADGLSQGSKWQQKSSGLQDSFQYSGRS